jgi:hypothetical protein
MSTFNLREFLIFAKLFLQVEQDCLRKLPAGGAERQKKIVASLDRFDSLEKWFDDYQMYFITTVTAEFAALERMAASAEFMRKDGADTDQQQKLIRSRLEEMLNYIHARFTQLRDTSAALKLRIYNEYP